MTNSTTLLDAAGKLATSWEGKDLSCLMLGELECCNARLHVRS